MRAGVIMLGLVVAACAAPGDAAEPSSNGCADVIAASVTPSGGSYTVSATIRSADVGWDKYADAFDVVGPDGTVLATRVLLHPHVDEQPFTRSLTGVLIPDGVAEVTVRARDSVAGFCGEAVTVAVA